MATPGPSNQTATAPMRARDQGEEFKMPTIVGALIFLVPIALLAGYGSKLAASRLSARWVWLKIL